MKIHRVVCIGKINGAKHSGAMHSKRTASSEWTDATQSEDEKKQVQNEFEQAVLLHLYHMPFPSFNLISFHGGRVAQQTKSLSRYTSFEQL